MKSLNYFELLAKTAIFRTEEKKIRDVIGIDSLTIRVKLSNKKKFTDMVKVVYLDEHN